MAHLRSKLKARSGAASIEGVITIGFMLLSTWIMWGVAIVIFNQGVMTTAAQFSAQAGLVNYSRNTYQGGGGVGPAQAQKQAAWRAAYTVYAANVCGILQVNAGSSTDISRYCSDSGDSRFEIGPGSFSSDPFGPLQFTFDVECGVFRSRSATAGKTSLSEINSMAAVRDAADEIVKGPNLCGTSQGREIVQTESQGYTEGPFSFARDESGNPQRSRAASFLIRPEVAR